MNTEDVPKLKTGTTTVGLIGKDCVILAADQKATMGNIAADLASTKIYQINNKVAVTTAGGSGDSLAMIRFLRSHAKLYEIERENPLTPKAAITLLANVLNSNRYYPYMAYMLLGGYNGKPELYSIDAVGGSSSEEKFTSMGSGFELAYGYLEEAFKEGMPMEKAIEIAIKSVKVAKKRDIFSGGESITVFVITKDGVRELEKKEVDKYA